MNVLLALIIKHFVCDFPLQAFPYMYNNKGIYGHLGGILHASVHAFGTAAVLLACGFSGDIAFWGGWIDGIIHYHIDWAKMRLGAYMGWMPNNSEWFWILLGFDQLLHYLTYWGIARWLS